jgi:hypothetical protein
MPQLFQNRPLNTKIVKGTRVYNLTSNTSRLFNSYDRMFSYHSDRTDFIDYDTSLLIDKPATRASYYSGPRLTSKLIVYKVQDRNEAGLLEPKYYKVNGQRVTDTQTLENAYCMRMQFSRSRIEEIQNIIEPRLRPRPASSPADIRRAVAEITIPDFVAYDTAPAEASERINQNLIYPYHQGPRTLNMRSLPGEDTDRYFGIELEMDASRDPNASSTKRHTLATWLDRILNEGNYNSLVKFESDASLGAQGIEMITQPMTIKFLMANKEKFHAAMREINALNYSSHDSGKCGMHIHVSRRALTEDMIDGLYLMFENFKNEIVAFSRRTQNGMNWCRFMVDRNGYEGSCPDNFDDNYIKQHKPTGNNHHSAINNGNSATVEFRIFRGTTKISTFIANVQLIDNMIEIVKNTPDLTGITWEQIINYNSDYRELIQYNEKRNIVSKHQLSKRINKMEVIERPVILVRPFQVTLEGDC